MSPSPSNNVSNNINNSNNNNINKRVVFNDNNNVINHVETFKDSSFKDDIWFTETEEADFQIREKQLAQSLQDMNPVELEIKFNESSRGLEYYYTRQPQPSQQQDSDEGNNSNKRHHHNHHNGNNISLLHRGKNSVKLVISTQKTFQRKGKRDTQFCRDSMAHVYKATSLDAAKDAMERAKQDEQFVIENVRKSLDITLKIQVEAAASASSIRRSYEQEQERRRDARPPVFGRQSAVRSLEMVDTHRKKCHFPLFLF